MAYGEYSVQLNKSAQQDFLHFVTLGLESPLEALETANVLKKTRQPRRGDNGVPPAAKFRSEGPFTYKEIWPFWPLTLTKKWRMRKMV
jgi:hypothetical protein